MWPAVAILLVVWAVLKFGMGKGGFIHILLVTAVSVALVQVIADRKTRYQNKTTGREP